MEFLDNSGHIFSLNDYKEKPIGYEFEETPYVFWINDQNNNSRLSINMYYGKVINMLYELDEYDEEKTISEQLNIEITLDSKIFSFIRCSDFQAAINSNKNVFEYILFNKSKSIVSSLYSNNDNDLCVVKFYEESQNKYYALIPLYIISIVDEPGTYSSQVLVHIWNDKNANKWCNFSVGGTFVDEYECLTIHGKNMGVNLPREILKAVYQQSFYEETFNEELYNKKIKEYMLNYMGIRGEKGNYNSALKSLKWFGYGKNLTLYKLLKNDNVYVEQFIRDDFNIYTDILDSFKHFIYTKCISVGFKINEDLTDNEGNIIYNIQSDNNPLWGEGNPKTQNLFNKLIVKETDEYFDTERFKYLDSYYKYSFYELSFKLSALAYYYQKYFLPIYVQLKNLTLEYKVYANDIKINNVKCNQFFNEPIVNVCNEDYDEVIFPKTKTLYLMHHKFIIDDTFNVLEISENKLSDYDVKSIFDLSFNDINKKDKLLFVGTEIQSSIDENNATIINDLDEIRIHKENETSTKWYFMIPNIYSYEIYSYEIHDDQILQHKDESYNEIDSNYLGQYRLYESLTQDSSINIILKKIKYNLYKINDSCVYIPISLKNDTGKYYNCIFALYQKNFNKLLYVSHFNFCNDKDTYLYKGFVFFPKFIDYILSKQNSKLYDIIDKEYIIYLCVNNTWYSYEFEVKVPAFDIDFGTIEYKYWTNDINYLYYYYKDNCKDDNDIIQFKSYELNNEYTLDITRYIKDKDLIDNYTKYVSPFTQIKTIKNGKIEFNAHINDTNFINVNDLSWGFETDISKLVNSHMSKVNLNSNNKLLNKVLTYDLYKCIQELSDKNEIIFKRNILLKCNGYLIQHNDLLFNTNEFNKFTFTGSNSYEISTLKDGIDYYINVNSISNKYSYYYFIRRKVRLDENGNVEYYDTNEYSTEMYTDQFINGDNEYLGYLIYSQKDIYDRNIYNENEQLIKNNIEYSKDLDIDKLYIDNGNFMYEGVKYALLINTKFAKYSPTIDEWLECDEVNSDYIYNEELHNENETDYYIMVKLYKQNYYRVLNKIQYVNEDDLNDEGKYEIDSNNNIVVNVHPVKNAKLLFDGEEIYDNNPTIYWYSGDDISNIDLIQLSPNNEIIFSDEIYKESSEYIINGGKFDDEEINDLNDNYDHVYHGTYSNYVCKNLTGLEKGRYEYRYEYEDNIINDNVKSCIIICRNDDSIENFSDTFSEITIYGNEKYIYMYFTINGDLSNGVTIKNISLKKIEDKEIHINYDKDQMLNMYNMFFYKKYEIIHNSDNINKSIREIWDSKISINENYDTYLMHSQIGSTINDNKSIYYFIFISKNTCDSFKTINELNYYPEVIDFIDEDTGDKYRLRFFKSTKSLLINRLYLNSSNGQNQFKEDDVIGVSIKNNDMLPLDLPVQSKWSLEPLSYGTSNDRLISGIGNTAIISAPKNIGKYGKGYYEVIVNYKLDNFIMNYQTLKSKILIK